MQNDNAANRPVDSGGWLHFLYVQDRRILFHGNLDGLATYLGDDERGGGDGLRCHAVYRLDRANLLTVSGIEADSLAIVETGKRHYAIVRSGHDATCLGSVDVCRCVLQVAIRLHPIEHCRGLVRLLVAICRGISRYVVGRCELHLAVLAISVVLDIGIGDGIVIFSSVCCACKLEFTTLFL